MYTFIKHTDAYTHTHIHIHLLYKHPTYSHTQIHTFTDSYTCIHSHFSLNAHIAYITSHNSQPYITHMHRKAPLFTYTHLYKYIDPHASHMHTATHNALALLHAHIHTH